ncbi:MAG TPA: non-heme iron oxygenase ferredoxin subunit [Pirellulaceae bacterium]|nr:non-heme iron oxygenase ferredoxin subunit [Pirellulaceae bacterium]
MTTASNSQTWHFAANLDDLPDEGQLTAIVADDVVILFRAGDAIYCIEDLCTHDGGSLSDGERCGLEIACPRHGARFDIRTGRALSMPATEATRSFPVQVIDRKIYVSVE